MWYGIPWDSLKAVTGLVRHTWRVQTGGEPYWNAGTESQKSHSPLHAHSAVTTSAVSCCHNPGAIVRPISMLMKLIHQDFYTYTDFFLVSLPKALLLKRNIFLSFKDKERPLFNAKYYIENFAKLWKTTKCFSWSLEAITLGFHSQMYKPWNVMDSTFQSKFLLYKTHVIDHWKLIKHNIPPPQCPMTSINLLMMFPPPSLR